MELIKKILYSFSIFLMVLLLFLTTTKMINLKTNKIDITFPQLSAYQEKYDKLYESVETITNEECRESVKEEIETSENLFFDENMTPKEIIEKIAINSIIIGYTSTYKTCGLKVNDENITLNSEDDKLSSLNAKLIAAHITYEDLMIKYASRYELDLNLRDNEFLEETTSYTLMSTRLTSSKVLEIERLESLIEVINNEE